MEEHFPKKIDIDCTSNVQFEVIPPDVADIPLPEDVSQIPLPNQNLNENTITVSNALEECINDSSEEILTINEELAEKDNQVQIAEIQNIDSEQGYYENHLSATDNIKKYEVKIDDGVIHQQANDESTIPEDTLQENITEQKEPVVECSSEVKIGHELVVNALLKNEIANISQNVDIVNTDIQKEVNEIEMKYSNMQEETNKNRESLAFSIEDTNNENVQRDEIVLPENAIIGSANITIESSEDTKKIENISFDTEASLTENVTSQEETEILENTNEQELDQLETVNLDNTDKQELSQLETINSDNTNEQVLPTLNKDDPLDTIESEVDNSKEIIYEELIKSKPEEASSKIEVIDTCVTDVEQAKTTNVISADLTQIAEQTNLINEELINETYSKQSNIVVQESSSESVVIIDHNEQEMLNEQIMQPVTISEQKKEEICVDTNQFIESSNQHQEGTELLIVNNDNGSLTNQKIQEPETNITADNNIEKTTTESVENSVERLEISESEVERLELSEDNVESSSPSMKNENIEIIVHSEKNNPISKTNIVEYIQTHDPSLEDDETTVQFVVTNDNESVIQQDGLEYQTVKASEHTLPEGVQYVVSEPSADDPNQHEYVQYVVSENSVEKLTQFQTSSETENPGEYIQYVVSEGSNQDNIVQFVVTSAANEKDIVHNVDSDNYVSYIVSETADEKDLSTEESVAPTDVSYEVIDETTQEQSDVIIEEMEVDNSANDQNEDIEIYVIEDDNMQVIEVHVEDPSLKKTKADAVSLNENEKVDLNSKKRAPIGNYIEVVDAKGDTTAKLPCHVLGRNLKNPELDVLSNGRNPPKVRPGVKVPPLSLTSCIVSTEEISEEIDKKLKTDVPYYDKPKVGDILFKHKITKRLAEKLCTIPPSNPKSLHNQTKISPNTRLAKKNLLAKVKPKLDNADLLAILEGDEDPDWSDLKNYEKDQAPPILQAIEKSIISGHSGKSPPPVLEAQHNPKSMQGSSRTPLKLDSEEKRRLAQHQLMNLPHVPNICSSRPRGRPKLTDYNPLKQTLLKNAGMAVYTTPRSKDPPKTYSNRKANDIIKNLVSDWDEESRDEPKKTSTPVTTKTTLQENKKSEVQQEKLTSKPQVSTPASEVKVINKTSSTVTATSVSSSNAKVTQTSTAKRKNSPISSTPQLGIVPHKIARVIKKKIIWDPDNPMTSPALSLSQKNVKKDIPKAQTELSPSIIKKVSETIAKKVAMNSNVSKNKLEKQPETISKNDESKIETKSKDPEEQVIEKESKNIESKKPREIRKTPHKQMFSNKDTDQKQSSSPDTPLLKKKKKLTEIDRLLSDEGAVNMIYSVERSHNNTEVPEIVTKPNKRLLISLEKERRNLLSKANIIKQAVLRHSSTTGLPSRNKKPLRFKKATMGMRKGNLKKKLDTSRIVPQSPMQEDNPDFSFTSINESRIIRRHSSSSYSSTCTSPRRLSVDLDAKASETTEENAQAIVPESELSKPLKKRQKGGVPIYSKPVENEKTYKGKTKSSSTDQNASSDDKNKSAPLEEEKSNKTINTRSNKKLNVTSADIDKSKTEKVVSNKEDTSNDVQESALMEVAPDTLPKDESPTPMASKKMKKASVVESDKVSLTKEIKTYKEISIRRHDNLVQIILTSTSTKFKNSLNVQILQELKEALLDFSKDATCHVVLLTSSGNLFCQGLDYSNLVQDSTEKRQQAVQEMVHALIDLFRVFAEFPKILVAGIHGAAIGFAVTMLPLFDLVLASDKATFNVPATKYGYIPEGTSLMPCYRLLSQAVVNELILACRELTASEALQYGLITRVIWPDKFQADLIPTIKAITNHSVQAMMVTKAMLRQHLLNGLDEALEIEKKQLTEMWMSADCQEGFKKAIEAGLWK